MEEWLVPAETRRRSDAAALRPPFFHFSAPPRLRANCPFLSRKGAKARRKIRDPGLRSEDGSAAIGRLNRRRFGKSFGCKRESRSDDLREPAGTSPTNAYG